MRALLSIAYLGICIELGAQQITAQQNKADFDYFWKTIETNYCYWDKKQTDWNKVKITYASQVDTVTSRASFVSVLEKVFYELYDHHASLNTNTPQSQRLVPSGADIWAEYANGQAIIIEVRRESGADKAGIVPGMEIVRFNDVSIDSAIQHFLPKCLKKPDIDARNYALRVLLAGSHSENRKITTKYGNQSRDFFPDRPVNLLEKNNYTAEIESRILPGNIGYIAINNSLGDNGLIPMFDSTLTSFRDTRAMILDLRRTPSGGNTSVARAMLGRFISKEGFYQKHELTSEELESGIKRSWVEIVSPRQPFYSKPLVVLVDHWTGSVGEGIAIGFDALKRGTIVGTKMAGLNGAIYSFVMPNSHIGFSFPAEKLFHVNGTPRENFKPAVQVDLLNKMGSEDYVLERAMKILSASPSTETKRISGTPKR